MKDELYMCDRGILNEFFALAGSTPSQNKRSGSDLLPLSVEETKRVERVAIEKTKQVEAEASARKAEAEAKKAEIEFEMLKFRVEHSLSC